MRLAVDGTWQTIQTGSYIEVMAELANRGEILPGAPRCTQRVQGVQYAVARDGDMKALAKAIKPREPVRPIKPKDLPNTARIG
jgi:hypothetical protein